jgi:hypothetical protein
MAIQIGKYKRPGIFIEEFDQSIITSPLVEGITNMVIGVSKKGPVNTPILLQNTGDLDAIFGQLDRNLERKGSYFHRTIAKMLETSPVFAINLLLTDDNLDVIEYKSLSAAAGYVNDIEREGPYRRFFDTTGFWKRDTESFINLTKNNTGYTERAFSLTNLSDRAITVFVFKSARTGFDRTLIEWYGSIERMPTYVNPKDWASDYMVDVVVVGGDWSNYQNLATDPRWSAYFNASGLRKDQIRNFANDRNVTNLAYYEGLSLIPYFRDANGTNIFIETTINRDTDRTGLFCAFNIDLVESDFYNGTLDLLGNSLVGKLDTEIDYLSYKETIAESIRFQNTPLDLPGNVTGLLGGTWTGYGYLNQDPHAFSDGSTIGPDSGNSPAVTSGIVYNEDVRTAWFAEGSVYNVQRLSAPSSSTASISVTYSVMSGAFAIIGNNFVQVSSTASVELSASEYPFTAAVATYSAAVVIDAEGDIMTVKSFSANTRPSVASSDIVLGYMEFSLLSGEFTGGGPVMYDVNIDTAGFIDYSFGTSSQDDYFITDLGSGRIKVEFQNTNTQQSVRNYEQFRRFKLFNRLVSLIDSPNKNRITMGLGPAMNYKKVSLANVTISNIVTSTTQNKSFELSTGLTSADLVDVLQGYLVFYTVDNEFLLGQKGVSTKDEVADGSNIGVAGRYSNFYTRYFDGIINTSDFFYDNRLWVDSSGSSSPNLGLAVNVIFQNGESAAGLTSAYAGYDYVIFNSTSSSFAGDIDLQTFEQLSFPDSNLNKGSFTVVTNSVNPSQTPQQLATALGYTSTAGDQYFAYQVNENTTYEFISDVTLVYNYLLRHYLKLYLDGSGLLTCEFKDVLLSSDEDVDTLANNVFFVQSEKSNFVQSIELEVPAGYVQVPNKVLINGSRYTEVKVGDFFEAFVDTSLLQPGEAPRKLTRILTKRQYSGNPELTEITCDSAIQTYNFGGDLQTMRYTAVEQYVSTYKAIALDGFRVRQASLPDGTEERQNQILNLVQKGTPLFKAITNKEAIDFRYLIDPFGLGLTERSKQQLVDICGDRLDAFGFINMPSLKSFKNSTSPSFVNSEGVLQLEFVAKGGDPESNPAFLYSFGDGAGSTCVGYFTPYITANDNGRPVDVPPAAWVATTYMRKQVSNNTSVTPWTIAAGVTNGRVTNIAGIEMDFTPSDIEFLNGAQMNPIVFKRNRGHVIETENTAQTLFSSALSFIHVREVLIELERELSNMLLDFQWKFNTPDVRAEIKLRADTICEKYVSKSGLYNYFNKMDEENNTTEIIDNQIGVLDTYVEPIKGMGIIVNNITILRTGAISAGGFINP